MAVDFSHEATGAPGTAMNAMRLSAEQSEDTQAQFVTSNSLLFPCWLEMGHRKNADNFSDFNRIAAKFPESLFSSLVKRANLQILGRIRGFSSFNFVIRC